MTGAGAGALGSFSLRFDSSSSSRSSNCSICRSNFSDLRPNCMRCSLASSNCRCSISRSRDCNCSCVVVSLSSAESNCSCWARISARNASAGKGVQIGERQPLTCAEYRMNSHVLIPRAREKSCAKNLASYTDSCGSQVRSGRRQSMPSSNIDNWARVRETVPLVACGHTKRPRSSRL